MKLLPSLLLILISSIALSQEKEIQIQGRVIDSNSNPVGDVYILNYRNLGKAVSRANGVFDISVFPGDSLMVSHVSYINKIIRVFDLMVNPVVRIEMDTVNILQVNVSPEQKTDLERASENIKTINWDPRPYSTDSYTEQEIILEMMNNENRVMHAESTSLKLFKFSPSNVVGFMVKKLKTRKQSNQYSSTRRNKKSYPEDSE